MAACPSAERSAGVAPVAVTEQNTATARDRGAVNAARGGQTDRQTDRRTDGRKEEADGTVSGAGGRMERQAGGKRDGPTDRGG